MEAKNGSLAIYPCYTIQLILQPTNFLHSRSIRVGIHELVANDKIARFRAGENLFVGCGTIKTGKTAFRG